MEGAGGPCLSILRSCLLPLTSSDLPFWLPRSWNGFTPADHAEPLLQQTPAQPGLAQSLSSVEAVSVPSISSHGSHRGPSTVLHPGRGLEAGRTHSQWSFLATVRKDSFLCNSGQNVRACVLSRFSRAWLFAIPWTTAHQAPLSMESSRQEYWSGSPCPLQGIFPTQRRNWNLLHLLPRQVGSLPLAPPGKPLQIKILEFISFLKHSLWRTPWYDIRFIPNIPQSLVYLSHVEMCAFWVFRVSFYYECILQRLSASSDFLVRVYRWFYEASALDVRDDWEIDPSSLLDVLFTVKYLNRWESALFQAHALLYPDTHTHTRAILYVTQPLVNISMGSLLCHALQRLLLTLMFVALVFLWKSWINLSKS